MSSALNPVDEIQFCRRALSKEGFRVKFSGKFAFLLVVAGFFVVGCASAPTQKKDNGVMEARIKSEPPAPTPEAIAERGAQTFINAPGLSDEQKRKIMAIYIRTFNDAIAIRNEIGQAKSLLFKMAARSGFNSSEMESLKKRIVDLDQKRLKVMFKALEDVQAIVGLGKDKEELWKHFYDFEYPKYNHVSSTN